MRPIVQKHKGKTAGGILKTAQIAEMQAGNVEIVATLAQNQLWVLNSRDDDAMVMHNYYGDVVMLQLSQTASKKLLDLEEKAEKLRESLQ